MYVCCKEVERFSELRVTGVGSERREEWRTTVRGEGRRLMLPVRHILQRGGFPRAVGALQLKTDERGKHSSARLSTLKE